LSAPEALAKAVGDAGRRIVAALAFRFRDLDLAEEAFAESCVLAVESWGRETPGDPAAWLYRVAYRRALDALRKRRKRDQFLAQSHDLGHSTEDVLIASKAQIPDDRLRLIFVCCHPALAPESRAALTLRVVCGLSAAEIAHAFLVSESTLAQRLVRAKRKITEAKIPFEIPGPEAWPERLDSVLSTLEIAYSKAHEDAASSGSHANYASDMLEFTRVLAELLPREPAVLALAALVRFAEARRPARLDSAGIMIPLSEQDPVLWLRPLIEAAQTYLERAMAVESPEPRVLQAAIHGAWCSRQTLQEPPPWPGVLALYDALLALRNDPVVRLNRAVAVAEVRGPDTALEELKELDDHALRGFLPYQVLRADLLRRTGHFEEARAAYDAALALQPTSAERLWLEKRQAKS